MREIKFRAWDKVAKRYLRPWPDGFHILGETMCFDMIGMQLKERSPEKTTLEMLNDVEIEQFTGLTDKNGKDLDWWEGDLLRKGSDHPNAPIGIISYDEQCARWVIASKAGNEFCGLEQAYRNGWKKIGNIHEGKEDD